MSWTGQFYPYSGGQQTSNQAITGANPALSLIGTETSGGTASIVEYQGGLFSLANVTYSATTGLFSLVNPAQPGTGLYVNKSGAITNYQAAAGTLAWTTWPTTLWGYSATGSLDVTDINTGGAALTIESPAIIQTIPNTGAGGMFVQNTTTAYPPGVFADQNVAGGGTVGFDSLNNVMRFSNTPYGGAQTPTMNLNATGGIANKAWLQLAAGGAVPSAMTNIGTTNQAVKIISGIAPVVVASGAASGSQPITLTGNAIFANVNSYQILVTANSGVPGFGGANSLPILAAAPTSASTFTVFLQAVSGTSTGTFTCNVSYLLIGY